MFFAIVGAIIVVVVGLAFAYDYRNRRHGETVSIATDAARDNLRDVLMRGREDSFTDRQP